MLLPLDLDRRAAFGAVPVDRDGQPDVLARGEVGQRRLVGVRERGPLRQDRALLRLDDRVGRADQLRPRHAPVDHEPLQDAAHLGVAFLVAGEVGGEVVERPDRAANVGQRQPGEQLPVLDVFGREGDGHGEQARPDAVLPGRDPERRAAADGRDHRPFNRQVVEQELRRLLLHDAEVRHVGLRIPHEEIENVVLAGVGAGRERRPRGGGFRRMARLEAVETALCREPGQVGQLACGHPLLGQFGLHPVETEDDHLLRVLRRGVRFLTGHDANRQGGREEQGAERLHVISLCIRAESARRPVLWLSKKYSGLPRLDLSPRRLLERCPM